jgi:hypothetical protein
MLGMTLGASSAQEMRISNDRGGQIGRYVDAFAMVRETGQRVVIDGPCLSACTLVLGMVPRSRICVTPQAVLGFHAAWRPGMDGAPVRSDPGTRFLWDAYPAHVKRWLQRKGGLSRRMVFLGGRELASMYPPCRGGGEVTAQARRR